MELQSETYERILARLEAGYREGKLKNRTDTILIFAELTKTGITEAEFRSVRKHLSRVLKHRRAIRSALRQGDEQIAKIKGALSSKPATTLNELGNQISKGWLVHEETASLEAGKEDLEAEAVRLKEESEALKESISKYHDLMDAWNDFVGWTTCGGSKIEL